MAYYFKDSKRFAFLNNFRDSKCFALLIKRI